MAQTPLPSRRPSWSCRPHVERLETRLALTCQPLFNPPQALLQVQCDDVDDAVVLTRAPDRRILFNGQFIPGNPNIDNTLQIHVDGGGGSDYLSLAGLIEYRGRTTLLGNRGNDIIEGSEISDLARGGPGDDFLLGHLGNDTLEGNGDNDAILGGEGHDRIFLGDPGGGGGLGGDTYELAFGDCGNDTLDGDLSGMSYDYIDGGCGNDLIRGWGLGDFLDGGDDQDTLQGGTGGDAVLGGNGEDVLFGEDGDDYLDGGPGSDLISGGAGDFDLWIFDSLDSEDGSTEYYI